MNPVTEAIEIVGLQPLAAAVGLSYQAVRKWEKRGMPRTEWTGETSYSRVIAQVTGGKVSVSDLLKTR